MLPSMREPTVAPLHGAEGFAVKSAVPRDELLRQVWGLEPKNIETRTVDMHVAHLRQKLRSPDAVLTVRGKGYMIAS